MMESRHKIFSMRLFQPLLLLKIHTYKEVKFLWIFNKYTMSTSCRIPDIAVFLTI